MSGFVDESQLHVRGGDGGAGAVSFRREAHVPRGGPDGGDGGRGGDVWLVASNRQASLLGFRDHPHRRAGDGKHGAGKRRHGATGEDLDVEVPVGTIVRSRGRAVLADLVSSGDRWLAAAGGQGGRGNARFLTNRRRAPFLPSKGRRGGTLARARAEAGCRRRPRRVSQCGQEQPDISCLRRARRSPTIPSRRWSRTWGWSG